MSTCGTSTKCTRYLRGLADFYVRTTKSDNPYACINDGQSITDSAGVSGATISLVNSPTQNSSSSIEVTTVTGIGDGITYTYPTPVDYSSLTNYYITLDIYPTVSAGADITFYDGVNTLTTPRDLIANEWNRVIIQPSTLAGTFIWSNLEEISILQNSATNLVTFNLQAIKQFASLADMNTPQLARVGCTREMGINIEEDFAELKCSDGSIVQRESLGKSLELSATVQDFDPAGQSVLSGGVITTSSVTRLIEGETFTVPTVTDPTYTLSYASQLKYGDGFGVFVFDNTTGCLLQEYADDENIPDGYYHVNPTTGVISFSNSDQNVEMVVNYNIVTTNGQTIEVNFQDSIIECAVQFRVKGANNQQALYYFPRVHTVTTAVNPAQDEFWTWEFNGQVLADPITGKVYEVHYTDSTI